MVSSRWLHVRQWCGNLPSSHLPNHDEAELEKRISWLYFASFRFADLRMQIRIKLKELPLSSQSARADNPAIYWDVLELFDEYLPLLLSIERYHSARHSDGTILLQLLTVFPPLFYGRDELNLVTDRYVGIQHRAQFSIPVELALVLCSMGQLYALHAESQLTQADDTLALARMQHAENSWQSAESFYRWASTYSCRYKEGLESRDSLTSTIWRFFEAMAIRTLTLSRMCSTHRLSTHISGVRIRRFKQLSLTEKSSERLCRIASVCARRALTLVREAKAQHSHLNKDRFSEQLKWCLNAYEIRWMAIYYQHELIIYRLDANPEIAICFCENLLKLRIPHFPSPASQQQDAGFSQFAHEIQLKHHRQITEALDEKKALVRECRRRFGTAWTFQLLDKCVGAELLRIRDMGPVFREEQRVLDAGVDEEERNYASPFLVEAVRANIDEAILQVKVDGPELIDSNLINKSAFIPIKKSQERGSNVSTVAIAAKSDTVAGPDKSGKEEGESWKPSNLGQGKKRPLSATPPQGSGWVTMNYGGKLLHFEQSVDPPQANQLETVLQRNTLSIQDDLIDDDKCSIVRRSKPRPSSSPCYLSSKTSLNSHEHAASSTGRQPDNTTIWAPLRTPCALCERRLMRSSLPGVVVMKRVYDLRRKWGVIQDSKKFNAPSALYGTAIVCLLCQEILAFEENKQLPKSPCSSDDKTLQRTSPEEFSTNPVVATGNDSNRGDEIAQMIHDSIMYRWHQQPSIPNENSTLEDIAINKHVHQSSTVCSMKAQNALDPDTNRTAQTKEELQPWWEIDLANYVEVHSVKVYLRDEVNHLYAATKRGLAANLVRQMTGGYPLHISISMRTGVGRDCDDIIASCVSSLCVPDKIGSPIEWIAPQKSRGRFVRIQCERRAILHIEHVHVYVVKPPQKVLTDPMVRRQHFRQKLQRVALCASVIATTATPLTESNRVVEAVELSPRERMSTLTPRISRSTSSQMLRRNTESPSQFASALFFDPEQAEKRRISRLYARFKSLLDARAKYVLPEETFDEDETK